MADKNIDLSQISEEEMLRLRLCDLPLKIEGTWLEECIQEFYRELDSKGIKFKPGCYLADEWLTPDGEPVVGIPFFLAHPALMKLEKKMMSDVEGGTKTWCMKLLRHEAGHAINYAYKLYKKKKWQKIFGKFSTVYADTYRFRPYSKNFVRHLEDYYAQYHPDEDFCETFSVWLTPDLDWRLQYKHWGALRKLKYVDELMQEIKDKEPLVKEGKRYWQASLMRTTLEHFYRKKKHSYAENFPDFHDVNLKKIFTFPASLSPNVNIADVSAAEDMKEAVNPRGKTAAVELIRKYKRDILDNVSAWTGEKKYIINELIGVIKERCKRLKLVSHGAEALAILRVSVYITTLVMNYMYTGKFKGGK